MENNKYGKAPSSSDRNAVERERRIQMNQLYSQLSSLLPLQPQFNPSQARKSQADKVEQAMYYIMEMKQKIQGLRERKEGLRKMIREEGLLNNNNNIIIINDDDIISDDDVIMMNDINITRLPIIQLSDLGDVVNVHLVTEIQRNLKLGELIRVFEEEGAEVLNTSFSIQGDKVYHTLYAKALDSRIGIETSRIQQRLQELV